MKHLPVKPVIDIDVLWEKIYNDLMINVSPGQLFGYNKPGWFRACYAFDEDTVKEACRRLATLKK